MPTRRDSFLRRVFEAPATGAWRYPRALLRVLILVPAEFRRDYGLQWSAALSFTTLFAMVPLAILAFALVSVFERMFDLDEQVVDLLLRQGLPDAADKARGEIRNLVDRVGAASGRLGVVGTLLLILTGLGLFSALERSVNRLWKIRSRGNPLRRFRAFWLVLTLWPALFGLSVWATARLRSPELREGFEALGPLLNAAVWVVPFLLTWTVFFLFYVYLPNTRVRLGPAVLAAIFAGSVWEVAKWGFNVYVSNAKQIDRVYGPLSILPLFILWIYLSWIIVLFGVELTYVLQNYRAVVAAAAGARTEHGATREYAALRLMVEIYRPFREGLKPPDLSDVARRVAVRTESTRQLLESLEKAGLVSQDPSGLYHPGREASRIRVAEIIEAVRGDFETLARVDDDPIARRLSESFAAAEEARTKAFDATLDDVLRHEQGPAEGAAGTAAAL